MKLPYTILAVLSAILFSAVSCVKEVNIVEQGDEVTILISTGDRQAQTRASEDTIDPLEEGNQCDDPDYRIGTLRVLIYHESNGLLYKKTEKFTPPDNPQSITLKTGRYNFVFIANEDLDGTFSTALDMLAEGSPFSKIATLKIDGAALNSKIMTGVPASGETDTFIPKVAMKGNVQVSKREGKTMIIESDGTTINNSTDNWEVAMTQTGIRIDLSLELTTSQMALYNENKLTLSFDNIPDHVDLLGKYNYTAGQTIIRTLGMPEVDLDNNELTWNRIILPETFFSDRSNKDNGIVLTASFDGGSTTYTATLGYDLTSASKDYTLPRNTYFKISGMISGSTTENIQLHITAASWGEPLSVDGDILNRTLNVSAVKATISASDHPPVRIYFNSNQQTVLLDAKGENSSGEEKDIDEFLDNPTTNFDYDNATGTGYIDLIPKTGATLGTYKIYLDAGGLRREIEITIQ